MHVDVIDTSDGYEWELDSHPVEDDPTDSTRWEARPRFVDADEVDPARSRFRDEFDTARDKLWSSAAEQPRPMENLRFEAFRVLAWLATLSVSVYAVLLVLPSFQNIALQDFATIVVAPIITIVATAAGYYFGSRSARQNEDADRRGTPSR